MFKWKASGFLVFQVHAFSLIPLSLSFVARTSVWKNPGEAPYHRSDDRAGAVLCMHKNLVWGLKGAHELVSTQVAQLHV